MAARNLVRTVARQIRVVFTRSHLTIATECNGCEKSVVASKNHTARILIAASVNFCSTNMPHPITGRSRSPNSCVLLSTGWLIRGLAFRLEPSAHLALLGRLEVQRLPPLVVDSNVSAFEGRQLAAIP